jgi:hypothetical protein
MIFQLFPNGAIGPQRSDLVLNRNAVELLFSLVPKVAENGNPGLKAVVPLGHHWNTPDTN